MNFISSFLLSFSYFELFLFVSFFPFCVNHIYFPSFRPYILEMSIFRLKFLLLSFIKLNTLRANFRYIVFKKLTPRSRVHLKKLIVTQRVKKFPSFYGTRRLITIFTYFPKMHFNIILLSTPTSSDWFILFRLSDQNFEYISRLSYACYMPRSSHPP